MPPPFAEPFGSPQCVYFILAFQRRKGKNKPDTLRCQETSFESHSSVKADAGVQIRGDLALGAGDFSVSPSRPGATSVLGVDSPTVQAYEVDLASWIHIRFLSFVNTGAKELSYKSPASLCFFSRPKPQTLPLPIGYSPKARFARHCASGR